MDIEREMKKKERLTIIPHGCKGAVMRVRDFRRVDTRLLVTAKRAVFISCAVFNLNEPNTNSLNQNIKVSR